MDIDARRNDLEAWLILLRTPGLGAAALRALVGRHGDAEKALRAARRGDPPIEDARARDWLDRPDPERIAADIAWLAAPDHHFVDCTASDFPPLLAETAGAPAGLFIDGDVTALWRPQLAIVGSRSATEGGLANARAFSRALAGAGFTITSGLAEGVDGAAHAAALDAGGLTIAVLGTGPDLVYPARHAELARRIVERGGARVSEFPPGVPGKPEHFPRRNRIIAGLALGTLVIEAGLRSGSLITARHAADAGREVFALPGSIHNPLARGCHQLIRQGATLTETAGEIIAALAPLAERLGVALKARLEGDPGASEEAGPRPVRRDPDYEKLVAALGHDAASLDVLAGRTGLSAAALSSMLLVLELEGEVVAERGVYALAHPEASARARADS